MTGTLHYEGSGSFKPETHVFELHRDHRVRTAHSWPPRDTTPSPRSYAEVLSDEKEVGKIAVNNSLSETNVAGALRSLPKKQRS